MPRPSQRWVLASLFSRLWRRHTEAWRALPAGWRRRWLLTIALGAIGMLLLMAVLEWLAQQAAASGALAWETEFLRTLETRTPCGFSTAIWIQTLGTDITLALIVVCGAAISARSHRPLLTLSIMLALVIVDLVVRFGWMLWDRPRPDLIAQGMAAPNFHSFPSGHTAKTVAVYGILASAWWRASQRTSERAFIIAGTTFILIIVPLARLRMGVHWPTDILGGYVIGAAWLVVLVAAGRFERSGDPFRPAPPA